MLALPVGGGCREFGSATPPVSRATAAAAAQSYCRWARPLGQWPATTNLLCGQLSSLARPPCQLLRLLIVAMLLRCCAASYCYHCSCFCCWFCSSFSLCCYSSTELLARPTGVLANSQTRPQGRRVGQSSNREGMKEIQVRIWNSFWIFFGLFLLLFLLVLLLLSGFLLLMLYEGDKNGYFPWLAIIEPREGGNELKRWGFNANQTSTWVCTHLATHPRLYSIKFPTPVVSKYGHGMKMGFSFGLGLKF